MQVKEMQDFLYNAKSTITFIINEDNLVQESNPLFRELFSYKEGEILSYLECFVNPPELFKLKENLHISLQTPYNSTIVIHASFYPQDRSTLVLGEIEKIENLTIVEKMSRLTSELASTTRNLHKKNLALDSAYTDLENRDRMLIAQNRFSAMNQLLVMLAHQWRQPLMMISLIINSLISSYKQEKLTLNIFQEKSNNILKILTELSKTINMFESKILQNQSQKINIATLLDDVCELMMVVFEEKEILLTKEFQTDQEIYTNPSILIQISLILIQNSLDAFEKKSISKPSVKLGCYIEDEKLHITYQDNGGGIKDSDIDKVFEPYFSTKTQKNDVGLGLYTAKFFLNKTMNGSINIKNFFDGVLVTLILPIKE